ncbi:carbon-nitrogen family hydrolase [Schwartzia sp. (in: firmicutes)]
MKISVLQLPVVIGDRAQNQQTLRSMFAQAMEEKPDVVLMPELWDIGFYPRPLEDYTDEGAASAKAVLSKLAKIYRVNIVGGSVAAQLGDAVENICCIFDREGNCIADYSKSHLFSPAREHDSFRAGSQVTTFTLDGVRCGVIICYDLRFPELARRLALSDIDILFIPAAWPTVRLAHWRLLTQARAVENQFFVAAANGSGSFANGMPLAGHSALIDPWGEILAEADEKPSILTADFDLSVKEKIRSTINVFADRRPDLY